MLLYPINHLHKIFHNILDILFTTRSHTAVLRALRQYSNGNTGREISRRAAMNHRACQKALTTPESIGIIERRRGGRDHLFTLDRTNILVTGGALPLLAIVRMTQFFYSLCVMTYALRFKIRGCPTHPSLVSYYGIEYLTTEERQSSLQQLP